MTRPDLDALREAFRERAAQPDYLQHSCPDRALIDALLDGMNGLRERIEALPSLDMSIPAGGLGGTVKEPMVMHVVSREAVRAALASPATGDSRQSEGLTSEASARMRLADEGDTAIFDGPIVRDLIATIDNMIAANHEVEDSRQSEGLREAIDNLRRSVEGRCINPRCPSRHEGAAPDCTEAAIAAVALAATPEPTLDAERLARAINDVTRPDPSETSLDWSVDYGREWYGTPRELAEEILARLHERTEP